MDRIRAVLQCRADRPSAPGPLGDRSTPRCSTGTWTLVEVEASRTSMAPDSDKEPRCRRPRRMSGCGHDTRSSRHTVADGELQDCIAVLLSHAYRAPGFHKPEEQGL